MKKINFLAIGFILLNFGLPPATVHAKSGGTSGVGGGGNSIAAHFVYIGNSALGFLKHEGLLTTEDIDNVIKRTSVFDVTDICFQDPNNGKTTCLDARYIATSSKIEFDRNRWKNKTCEEKFALASHEYLRAAGLEDSNYKYSNTFLGGGPEGVYFKEMTAICNNLSTSISSEQSQSPSMINTTCGKELKYLDSILRSYDNAKCDDEKSKASYSELLNSTMRKWMEIYGYDCLPRASDKCMEICIPKAGGSCFSNCNFAG